MRKNAAFTIVEIIVVIVTISILAGITSVGYAGLQKSSRDKERESDAAVIQNSLEAYYEKTGTYPPRDAVIGESATVLNFLTRDLNLPATAFISPSATSTAKNSFAWGTGTSATQYSYISYLENNNQCHATTAVCTKYRLSYGREQDSAVVLSSKYGW
ncbi:MAG: prepilin-type N-terminal cleavage/methylation domain-containing protein [Candidatus Saccharimonadales bacterium]